MMRPPFGNRSRHRVAVFLTGAVIVDFLVMDILLTRFTKEPGFLALLFVIGIGIGQVNLIAVWTALAPGNFVQRFSWSLLLIAWSWYAFVIGQRWGYSGTTQIDLTFSAGIVGCALLIGFVAAQVPLWLAGKVFRWRLVSWYHSSDQRVQFSLRNLLLAMLAIPLTIAPGKFILPNGRWDLTALLESPRPVWPSLGVFVLTNVLITIPGVWIAFIKRRYTLLVLVFWLVYCTLITGVEMGIVFTLLRGMFRRNDLEMKCLVYLSVWLINSTQFAVVYGALEIFRAIGFQFVRSPRKVAVA